MNFVKYSEIFVFEYSVFGWIEYSVTEYSVIRIFKFLVISNIRSYRIFGYSVEPNIRCTEYSVNRITNIRISNTNISEYFRIPDKVNFFMFLVAILDVNGNIKVSFVVAITLMVTTARLNEFARKKVNEYLENGRDMVHVESATRSHKFCNMLYVILIMSAL